MTSEEINAIMANTTEMTQSLKAPCSPPGTCVKVYSARGSVLVSPGIFETKVIVAPNSPKLRANARITPVRMPGMMIGSVIVKKIRTEFAPRVRAAASSP
jgi:hypothetical protein